MATKTQKATKSPSSSSTEVTDHFQNEVENALKHFHEPAWLGANSPLATPYFLGEAAATGQRVAADVAHYGKVLQQLLRTAADMVTARNARFGDLWQQLLKLRYFNSVPPV